jgi:hypothetical protein
MYAKDTILALKQPKEADSETGEAFPYNEVRVVGQSPVSHSHKGEWTGGDAAGVILTPLTNFGATLDEPFGKCRALYDVKEIPEVVIEQEQQKIRVVDSSTAAAGKTPEEVFAVEAPGEKPEAGQRRARTSPLGEVKNEAASGPLGDVEVEPLPAPKPVNPSPLDSEPAPLPVPVDPPEDEDPPVAERKSPLDDE